MSQAFPPPPGASSPFEITHRGHVYGLGVGPTAFAIWRLEGRPEGIEQRLSQVLFR